MSGYFDWILIGLFQSSSVKTFQPLIIILIETLKSAMCNDIKIRLKKEGLEEKLERTPLKKLIIEVFQ